MDHNHIYVDELFIISVVSAESLMETYPESFCRSSINSKLSDDWRHL